MADTYVVEVDIDQLRQNLARRERRALTHDELQLWLAQSGFYPRIDGLYVAEDSVLDKLRPDEIRQARLVGNILH